ILNFDPKAAAKVNFKNEDRAPLLFIAGQLDHIMPSTVNRANAKKYRTGVIAFREFEGRDHFIAGEKGWEEVASFALDWANQPTAFGVN
ncbi:MAG: alpha/beta hydrolase, partial [Archangium gephyra]